MAENIINRLVDGFMKTFRIKNVSYRRLVYCVDHPPIKLVRLVYNLSYPIDGYELEYAFRISRFDLRFGTAMIRGKIKKCILIDIKSSGYEKVSGRYVVYTLKEIEPNTYQVEYCTHEMNRLPFHWKETRQFAFASFT